MTQCPSIPGALIENGGSAGTAGSHWDRQFFGEEVMGPDDCSYPVISGVTMAYFNDLPI